MENKRMPNRLGMDCVVKEQMDPCKSVMWPGREVDGTRLNLYRVRES